MSTLRPADLRSLALLAELASQAREPSRVLRDQARFLPRRLRALADKTASAWERGEALPQELGDDGLRDDMTGAFHLLVASADAADAAHRAIARRALVPAMTASLALLASSAALALAAPAVRDLVEELSLSLGGPPVSPLLAFVAAHGPAVLVAGIACSLALSLAPALLPRLARTRRGAALCARVPLAGPLQSSLAARDFAACFGAGLAAGLPDHESASRAARHATNPWARLRLLACAARLQAGDPAEAAFADEALPDLAPLRAAGMDASGGLDAARRAEASAAERAARAATNLGRTAAACAYLLTGAATLLLVRAVMLPLMTLGGIAP